MSCDLYGIVGGGLISFLLPVGPPTSTRVQAHVIKKDSASRYLLCFGLAGDPLDHMAHHSSFFQSPDGQKLP